jgi:hypothetical protein
MMSRKIFWMLFFAMLAGCIDPIDFDTIPTELQLVVDGSITNEPGPYTVSLFRTRALKADLDYRLPVPGATIKIMSDAGEEETLTDLGAGIYKTKFIQGVVGRSYSIHIRTDNGNTYESEPELIKPPGKIDSLWFEYEQRRRVIDDAEINEDRLNVLLNSTMAAGEENHLRWRVVGTYQIVTTPELRTKANPGQPPPIRVPDPPPCSGWVERGFELVEVADCTCCICWVSNYEPLPLVSDDEFIEGAQFRRKAVAAVPVDAKYFVDKYHVSVSQMSLNKGAYTYFSLIKAQKENSTSLFQPVSGKLRGNITRTNGDEEVQGLFWAAGVSNVAVFVTRDDLPYHLAAPKPFIIECNVLKNSTAIKPSFWK